MALMNTLETAIKKLPVVCGIAALMTLGMNAKAMAAILYDITDLGILPSATRTYASGLNDLGQVVGTAYGDRYQRGFLWSESTGMKDLGFLQTEYPTSSASDINNAGQVVGTVDGYFAEYILSGSRPFFWSQDTGMVGLALSSNYKDGFGKAINNSGQVLGNVQGGLTSMSFVWSQSTGENYLNLNDLLGDYEYLYANDLNDNGQLVGSIGKYYPPGERAFLSSIDGSITEIGTLPGRDFSGASLINNVGQVVGTSYNLDDEFNLIDNSTFLWSITSGMTDIGYYFYPTDINDSGQVVGSFDGSPIVWSSSNGIIYLNTVINPSQDWKLIEASAINEKGQIAGTGINQSGQTRALLLTPRSGEAVPEPMTIGSTLLAGAGLAYLRRRQLLSSSKVAE